MSRKCQLTGRGPQIGNKVSHAHNLTKRRWDINLQKVRVLVDGRVVRMRVSTKAIKSGLIVKPPVTLRARKSRIHRPQVAAAIAAMAEEEITEDYFSSDSVVTRIFKPKKGKGDLVHGEDKFLMNDYEDDDTEDEEPLIPPRREALVKAKPATAKAEADVPAELDAPVVAVPSPEVETSFAPELPAEPDEDKQD